MITKIIICLLVIGLLAGNALADSFTVHVSDYKDKPISGASIKINACNTINTNTTNSAGMCKFNVPRTCNTIKVYVNGNLKWSGKYQPYVNILV